MLDKVGEEFKGIITAVTGFGFFVELDNIFVEGLVHITNLPQDYFHFDAKTHQLKGERTGIRFRLGDKVKVKVARVDLDEKKIDFDLLGSSKSTRTNKPKKSAKKAKMTDKKKSKSKFSKAKLKPKDSNKKTTKKKKSTQTKKTSSKKKSSKK